MTYERPSLVSPKEPEWLPKPTAPSRSVQRMVGQLGTFMDDGLETPCRITSIEEPVLFITFWNRRLGQVVKGGAIHQKEFVPDELPNDPSSATDAPADDVERKGNTK